ncbi:MAG: hypothetical protein QOJ65_866 [Fimbriimonadaceae bacterium]|nr:hypothetical protein [Fimbriimonadaceae bacterium]
MTRITNENAVRLAGAELGRARHACAFFHTRDEEYAITMPFIKEGFDLNDRAFHIVDPQMKADHFQRLADQGLDVAGLQAAGSLEVRQWDEAYLRGGRFDQNAMLHLIEEVLIAGTAKGYRLTRLVANMEWALEDRPGVSDVVEYETRLNYLLPKYDDAVT